MEAVFDLERLAERPLLRAGAHHAGRDSPGVARLYADVVDLAGDALLPEVEVDAGEGVAVDARVEEGVGDVEDGALHRAHVVRSLADNLRMKRMRVRTVNVLDVPKAAA